MNTCFLSNLQSNRIPLYRLTPHWPGELAMFDYQIVCVFEGTYSFETQCLNVAGIGCSIYTINKQQSNGLDMEASALSHSFLPNPFMITSLASEIVTSSSSMRVIVSFLSMRPAGMSTNIILQDYAGIVLTSTLTINSFRAGSSTLVPPRDLT